MTEVLLIYRHGSKLDKPTRFVQIACDLRYSVVLITFLCVKCHIIPCDSAISRFNMKI